jgi:transaldolase
MLEPAFEKYKGINGRLSMQTNPAIARDAKKVADQAVEFSNLAKNIVVKIPATKVGVSAIEDATYRGVSVNVTVSFSVPQAVETARAIERGLNRRRAEGLDVSTMGPVVTIMVGRLDDYMKDVATKNNIAITPGYLDWAGVAAFKNAYRIFNENHFTARLLSAAFRNYMHLTEFVGGNVVVSPPFKWQKFIDKNHIELVNRMDVSVDKKIVDELLARIPEFSKAFYEDGMSIAEFDTFGATRKTMRQFLSANAELDSLVRDIIMP